VADYCFDTSALLEAWARYYPPDVFPSFWERIEESITDGAIVCPDEVLVELAKKEDDLHKWAKARANLFHPLTEDVQRAAGRVLAAFPRLVDTRRGRSQADPFVIGLAMTADRTVVTAEKASGKPEKPRIPNVCDSLSVKWIPLIDFMRKQGWQF
jgi:hypothetical protein